MCRSLWSWIMCLSKWSWRDGRSLYGLRLSTFRCGGRETEKKVRRSCEGLLRRADLSLLMVAGLLTMRGVLLFRGSLKTWWKGISFYKKSSGSCRASVGFLINLDTLRLMPGFTQKWGLRRFLLGESIIKTLLRESLRSPSTFFGGRFKNILATNTNFLSLFYKTHTSSLLASTSTKGLTRTILSSQTRLWSGPTTPSPNQLS